MTLAVTPLLASDMMLRALGGLQVDGCDRNGVQEGAIEAEAATRRVGGSEQEAAAAASVSDSTRSGATRREDAASREQRKGVSILLFARRL